MHMDPQLAFRLTGELQVRKCRTSGRRGIRRIGRLQIERIQQVELHIGKTIRAWNPARRHVKDLMKISQLRMALEVHLVRSEQNRIDMIVILSLS